MVNNVNGRIGRRNYYCPFDGSGFDDFSLSFVSQKFNYLENALGTFPFSKREQQLKGEKLNLSKKIEVFTSFNVVLNTFFHATASTPLSFSPSTAYHK